MYELVADPMEVANRASYTGLFSQVSNLLWGATAAICLFSATLIGKQNVKQNDRTFLFLLLSGLLSIQLLLDDLLQLHEKFSRVLYGNQAAISGADQSFSEMVIYVVYAVLFFLFVFAFRKLLLSSKPLFLLLAATFFGLSTIIDMTPESLFGHHLLEESFKLLGIVSWFTYFFRVCLQKIQQHFDHSSKSAFQQSDAF